MSIALDLSKGGYPESYPVKIDTGDIDTFTAETFEQNICSAIEGKVPYYAVAVVTSGAENENYYHFYDGSAFYSYVAGKQPVSLCDPVAGRTIKDVHYFVLSCFDFNAQIVCRKIKLDDKSKLKFVPLIFPQDADAERLQRVFAESINYQRIRSLSDGEKSQQNQEDLFDIRQAQFTISQQVNKGLLFKGSKKQQTREEIKWLWCAATASAEPSVAACVELTRKVLVCQKGKDSPGWVKPKNIVCRLLDQLGENRHFPLTKDERLKLCNLSGLLEKRRLSVPPGLFSQLQ